MNLFPIFLRLAGQRALVVGAGVVAEAKVGSLLESGAVVKVIAPRATPTISAWSAAGAIDWQPRRFEAGDVEGSRIVFTATGVEAVDQAVVDICRERGILSNAVDDPPNCDFYSPAVVRRGDLQIAISTNGQSPALAQRIRASLERQFDSAWAARLAELGNRRRQILASVPAGNARRQRLRQMAADALGKQKHSRHQPCGRGRSADHESGGYASPQSSLLGRFRLGIIRRLQAREDRVLT